MLSSNIRSNILTKCLLWKLYGTFPNLALVKGCSWQKIYSTPPLLRRNFIVLNNCIRTAPLQTWLHFCAMYSNIQQASGEIHVYCRHSILIGIILPNIWIYLFVENENGCAVSLSSVLVFTGFITQFYFFVMCKKGSFYSLLPMQFCLKYYIC